MSDSNKTTDLQKFAEELVNLTVKQVTELSNILKEKYGIEPPTAIAPVEAASSASDKEEKKEEKTNFNVVLKAVGDTKLKVIKSIKNITQLGLKESKELADSAPKLIKEGVDKTEAEKIKKELEEAGAQVVLE